MIRVVFIQCWNLYSILGTFANDPTRRPISLVLFQNACLMYVVYNDIERIRVK